MGASLSWSGEFILDPNLSISEEHNDNIYLTKDNKKEDFITHVMPGFYSRYLTPLWDWRGTYQFDYSHYDFNNHGDEFVHYLDGAVNMRLIDNFMFFDIIDNFQRVSLYPYQNTQELSQFVNQTNRNIFRVSPYFKFNPTKTLTLTTGYQFSNTSYSNTSNSSFGDNVLRPRDMVEHVVFITSDYEINPKFYYNAGITYSYIIVNPLNYSRLTPTAGFSYGHVDRTLLDAAVGISWLNFENGLRRVNPFWKLHLSQNFHTWTASLKSLVTYNDEPVYSSSRTYSHLGKLSKSFRRANLEFSTGYSETTNLYSEEGVARRTWIGMYSLYEFTPRLKGFLELSANKYAGTGVYNGYPYKFVVGTRIDYFLMKQLKCSLSYQHSSYQNSIGNSGSSLSDNRVILQIGKYLDDPVIHKKIYPDFGPVVQSPELL